jgi:hypothetical protein
MVWLAMVPCARMRGNRLAVDGCRRPARPIRSRQGMDGPVDLELRIETPVRGRFWPVKGADRPMPTLAARRRDEVWS